jgi:ATP-dependent RNA helicase DDX56/DBP9
MSYFLDEEKTWMQRDFSLDRRLIKALSKLGFIYPTLVQAKCIPIITQGKDVLVRAKTGSGKTIAFSLPILQKVLSMKDSNPNAPQSIKCIILAPTKELIKQIEKHINDLMYYCRDNISICSLVEENNSALKYSLQSKPDIVVATPARLVQTLKSMDLDLSAVNTLIMDEADLVLSFGYTEDVHTIISKMPKIFQGILMSATLSAELDKFKRVVLHNPALLKLEEPEGAANLLQFYLKCTEKDKFLTLYVFIKLGLLQGKGLIFVNDVNKCYKLKLFFQQFFINTAVLNAEVPLNSRLHILEVHLFLFIHVSLLCN